MEAKMDKMPMYMHNAFWQENQISVTFMVSSQPGKAFPSIQEINSGLEQKLNYLNENIKDLGFTLSFFTQENVRGPVLSRPSQLSSFSGVTVKGDSDTLPPGVYLFPPPPDFIFDEKSIERPMISFFHLDEARPMAEEHVIGTVQEDYNDDPRLEPLVRVVNRINRLLQVDKIQSEQPVSISAAAPNWFCGASQGQGPLPVGCPLTPPIPVPTNLACSSSPGLFPITLPELPRSDPDLRSLTGDGVTVFILDTLPRREQITRAAQAAEENNLLLLDIADNDHVKLNYDFLPDVLDVPGPLQPATGKDIHGRLVGFRMPDHGLFAAGIVHDLAPNANIECTRVLNDMCVGDCETLSRALQHIYNRMQRGDLQNTPVVINLSLVIPPDFEVIKHGLDINKQIRDNLFKPMQNLVTLGAIFVASAGNEIDLRYNPMNPPQARPEAIYPAAFAYDGLDRVIPVGGVDQLGKATAYSCNPGPRGVATYGGDVPKDADIKFVDGKTKVTKVDALIGVYSSISYPALAIEDHQPSYAVPNANGWAYWVGTSFATPIVSAVAARALELKLRGQNSAIIDPQQIIVGPAATRKTKWTHLESRSGGSAEGKVIWAVQCRATK